MLEKFQPLTKVFMLFVSFMSAYTGPCASWPQALVSFLKLTVPIHPGMVVQQNSERNTLGWCVLWRFLSCSCLGALPARISMDNVAWLVSSYAIVVRTHFIMSLPIGT